METSPFIPSLAELHCLTFENGTITCIWHTKRKEKGLTQRCSRRLGTDKLKELRSLVETLDTRDKQAAEYRDTLGTLSSLLLCPHNHRGNSRHVYNVWISELDARQNRKPKRSSTYPNKEEIPVLRGNNTPRPNINTESIRRTTRSSTAAQSQEQVKSPPVFTTPPSSNTRSKTASNSTSSASPPLKPLKSLFTPYTTSPNPHQQSKNLQCKILTPLSPQDQKPGSIYALQRPGTHHIKIGVTNNITRRMAEHRSKCNYEPHLLFQIHTTNSYRVEKLIQMYLADSRCHENQARGTGKCNDGKGCEMRHMEWFDASIVRVKRVITLVVEWMKTNPYYDLDGGARLKSEWGTLIKSMDSRSALFEARWSDFFTARLVKKEEEEEVGPSKVKVENTHRVGKTRIKLEHENLDCLKREWASLIRTNTCIMAM